MEKLSLEPSGGAQRLVFLTKKRTDNPISWITGSYFIQLFACYQPFAFTSCRLGPIMRL